MAAFLAALAIRVIRINARSLWLDDGFSVWLASQPLPVILGYEDYHPPLYYVLLKAWQALGPWTASDGGVRLPSALASAGSVGVAVWLVLRLELPGAGMVAALGVTSALSVWYAQEARMYAPAALAVLCAVGGLACAARTTRRLAPSQLARSHGVARAQWPRQMTPWASYALSAVTASYLSYDALPVLVLANGAFHVSLALCHSPRRGPAVCGPRWLAGRARRCWPEPHTSHRWPTS